MLTLSHWSIIFQMSVIFILFLFFLTGWLITKRNALKSWTLGWFFNFLALLSVFFVVGKSEWSLQAKYFYLLYSVFKFLFIYFLLLGFYQFNRSYNLFKFQLFSFVIFTLATIAIIVSFVRFTTVHIQALVFLAAGLLAVTGGLSEWRRAFKSKNIGSILLSLSFILYGAIFLHHGFIIFPYFFGKDVPLFMSHISFLDAFAELGIGILIFLSTMLYTFKELRRAITQLQESRKEFRRLADIDPLTGLYNRRKLRSFINELGEAEGVVVFIDINNFKKVNDDWGHQAGDRCLRKLAELLKDIFRGEDGIFRYGGDEFLLVIPRVDRDVVAERLKKLKRILQQPGKEHIPINLSIGMGEFGIGKTFSEAINEADEEMYRSKEK